MNSAQKALLARLRELIEETPKSGALNAGKKPLYVTRFAQAVERRAEDGDALVKYVRSKIHEKATDGYSALIEAGRPDLTVEAVVADEEADWASEFDDADRSAARARLGEMHDAVNDRREIAESAAVEHDWKIIARMNERREAEGKQPLSPQQEADVLERRTKERAAKT